MCVAVVMKAWYVSKGRQQTLSPAYQFIPQSDDGEAGVFQQKKVRSVRVDKSAADGHSECSSECSGACACRRDLIELPHFGLIGWLAARACIAI